MIEGYKTQRCKCDHFRIEHLLMKGWDTPVDDLVKQSIDGKKK